MSFILDALNKAENERHLGHVPTIESQQVTITEEKKPQTTAIVVIVALMLNFALLAYVFIGKTDVKGPEKLVQSQSGQVTSVMQMKPGPNSVVKNDINNPVVVTTQKPVSTDGVVFNKTESHQPQKKILSPMDDVNQKMAVLLKNNTPINDTVNDTNVTMPNKEKVPSFDQATNVSPVQISAADPDIPLLSQKSSAFQQQIPELTIDVHVYSATPAKRFILINLQKYQEDDVIAKGLMLDQITEEGLVLSYQDEQFRWPMLTQ